jgi:FtsX-like permease family protein
MLRHAAAVVLAVCLGGVVVVADAVAADAGALADRVKADVAWLTKRPTRIVGSDEHRQTHGELLKRVRALDGVKVWTQSFEVIMPQVLEARLTLGTGDAPKPVQPHRIYPLWPANVRLNTTPPEGISGKLIYIGEGQPGVGWGRLPARSLRGQIAVMEMTGSSRWRTAFATGARAIILLGSDETNVRHFHSHLLPVPLNLPRFYVPNGPLAEQLREGAGSGVLYSRAKWARATATNIYALVKPQGGKPRKAIVVGAPFDSTSIVPELAPGADSAIDTALALQALEHFAQAPPKRPVLFAFIDAYGMNQRGVREMLHALALEPDDRNLRNYRERDEKVEERYREPRELADELDPRGDAGIQQLRRLTEGHFRPLYRHIKDEVAKVVVRYDNKMYPIRIRRFGIRRAIKSIKTELETPGKDTDPAKLEAELATREADLEALEASLAKLRKVRAAHHHAQKELITKDPPPMGQEVVDLAVTIWRRARQRALGQHEEILGAIKRRAGRAGLRAEVAAELGLEDGEAMPVEFFFGLDLSDAGISAGPSRYGALLRYSEVQNAHEFSRWLERVNKKERAALWPGRQGVAVDLTPITTSIAPASFTLGALPTFTSPAASFRLAAITWATLDAVRPRIDTPADRAEALNWERLGPQVDATMSLLRRMLRDTSFKPKTPVHAKWCRVEGMVVDQASGEPVPRLPMKDYLVTTLPGSVSTGSVTVRYSAVAGVRRIEFGLTGADGKFRFDALPVHRNRSDASLHLHAYRLDDSGRITRSVDMLSDGTGVRLNANIGSARPASLRAVAFSSEEMAVGGLFDARFLINLTSTALLDADRGSAPQQMNLQRSGDLMVCQLEPRTRWQLILRAGIAGNRMALLNMDPAALEPGSTMAVRDAMRGFGLHEPLPSIPMHVAARDFYQLDRKRLDDYEKAGITNQAIRKLQRQTRRQLKRADKALAADDAAALMKAASGAMSREVRAYQAVRNTASDIVHGAIFLLLMLVPFSYAFERLAFASAHVYHQIAGVLGVFAVMAFVLWNYHPAFEISGQPLMIIMAFAVIFMSLLVIGVVYAKFQSGLDEVRSGLAESSGARTSRLGVLTTALRLGIANMRRRKFRTALTGTTVMLITFAMLCFMSTSSYQGRSEFRIADQAPFTGVLIRQPGSRAMPPAAQFYLQQIVGEERPLVPRYWYNRQDSAEWRFLVRNPKNGKVAPLLAALGLAPEEDAMTGVGRACPNWARFAEEGGCYLPAEEAKKLGVKPGDPVVIGGTELELIGLIDEGAMREIRRLDGEVIRPLDYTQMTKEQRDEITDMSVERLTLELASGASFEPDEQLKHVTPDKLVIVPADVLRNMPGSTIRSIAVQTQSVEEAKKLAGEMAERLAFPVYYGQPEGVSVLAATPLVPKAPKSLIIPIVIAGLIIFNTMLSSIAERRKEIYIYTSLGLAPLHVGFLFLAEALTYGLMGSIFGYIIGQGMATGLSSMGWLGGLTLNYSGTQAILTMVLVLGVVVVSSLIPAFMAGRLATPSNEMTWKVPAPVDGVIHDKLPFTVTGKTADGVMAFLLEYMDAHSEGSIGNFSTADLSAVELDIEGRPFHGLECTVWLAPYDLGIRQTARILVGSAGEEDIYSLHIELTRQSGQESSWWKLNRGLLADLRKQLLGWRKLKTQRMLEYITEATERLGRAEKQGLAQAE